jgi:O-acetyl-ADP-ribose deacetylase (regulator of RNase III)
MSTKTTESFDYCGLDLDMGQIVPRRILKRGEEGHAVITAVEPARWRGEDRDVYAHVNYWYEARPATEAEAAKCETYAAAQSAWRLTLKALGLVTTDVARVDADGLHTRPLRRLDSYDDRWDGDIPRTIALTDEQRATYEAAQAAPRPYVEELDETFDFGGDGDGEDEGYVQI